MTTPSEPPPSAIVVALPAEGQTLPSKVVDGESGAEDDSPLHVTVRYFGSPDPAALPSLIELLTHLAETCAPFDATISGRGRLGKNDAGVLFVESEAIQDLHDLLDGAMPGGDPDKFPHFTPHLTIGYGDEVDVEGLDVASLPDRIVFDRIALWNGDERMEYPMVGTEELDDDAADGAGEKDLMLADGSPLTAAGVSIPTIEGDADLDAAIAYAVDNPGARWYVEARAAALRGSAALPWDVDLDDEALTADASPVEDDDGEDESDAHELILGPGGVQAAAAYYVRARSLGMTPDQSVYDEMIADAATEGMTGDPVVLSAVAWHERGD